MGDATLEELIKKQNKLKLEIRRYEKDKELRKAHIIEPTSEFVYIMNKEYLEEIIHMIDEKKKYWIGEISCII